MSRFFHCNFSHVTRQNCDSQIVVSMSLRYCIRPSLTFKPFLIPANCINFSARYSFACLPITGREFSRLIIYWNKEKQRNKVFYSVVCHLLYYQLILSRFFCLKLCRMKLFYKVFINSMNFLKKIRLSS